MQTLIPDPLHPAVVHLPVALAVLLPIIVLGAIWFVRRGARPLAAWGVAVAFMGMLVASTLVARETGEQQEERVEAVVPEGALGTHERAADAFLVAAAGVLLVGLAGFAPGRLGQAGRWVAAAGTLAILVTGWQVGHSGGMLVYRDGAASVYASGGAVQPGDAPANEGAERRRGGEDDR